MGNFKENAMRIVFIICACVSIVAVALICIFLFANGLPAMSEIGFGNFLFGMEWKPSQNLFGIFPMIIGSIYVTAGAIIIGVPIGLFCAVFLAKFCPKKLYKILKPAVELLAGIPSIVYGFFGLVVLVPAAYLLAKFGGLHMVWWSFPIAEVMSFIVSLTFLIKIWNDIIKDIPEGRE